MNLESQLRRGDPPRVSSSSQRPRINWVGSLPFLVMHLIPLGLFFTQPQLSDFLWCLGLYYARMFFITAGYHRYFAHRGYKLGRVMQFVMAFGGATAVQKGPLWWAGNHRRHHRFSDTEQDVHSPRHGFFWSHIGWIMSDKHAQTPLESIKDFARYPELRWLNRYHLVPPALLAVACYLLGGINGLLVWFFLSTVVLWHGTFTINSLAHVFGRRRFATSDTSKNSLLLALITMGEGWHNNHHFFAPTANQGFYWWQIDMSYYILLGLSRLGLASDLRRPPPHILAKGRLKQTAPIGSAPPASVMAAHRRVSEALEPVEPALDV